MENREKTRFIKTAKDNLPKMAVALIVYGYASVLIYNISSTLFFLLLVLSGFVLLKMDYVKKLVAKLNAFFTKFRGFKAKEGKTKNS